MTTRRIPRDQWVPFLDQFSRNHGGWLARVEVLGNQIGAQTEASNLPLLGVSADVKDQAHSIAVALGHDPASHLTHEIEGVKELWIEEVDEGHETLQVASDSGVTTLLHVSLDDPAQIPS